MSDLQATVIVPVHNEAKYLGALVQSLLKQTMPDFELIIVDDGSTDNTETVVRGFADPRIIYVRNDKNLGVAACRNKAVKMARSENLFFTDGDCVVAANWLEEGLRLLREGNYAGLEGNLIFVSSDYRPLYSDRVVENRKGGQYMTANMAYRKDCLIEAGLFDTSLRRYSDRAAALQVKHLGRVAFAPGMLVYHVRARWKFKTFFKYATAACYTVLLYKSHPEDQRGHGIFWHVYAPEKLASIVFPPLILRQLRGYRLRTWRDFVLLLLTYPTNVYERIELWKASLQERVFLV
jgi:glycosyltransferase involved in cell wall biosynthesis